MGKKVYVKLGEYDLVNELRKETYSKPWQRRFEKFKYPGSIDPECIDLCDAMNSLPGIHTIDSCYGHGINRFSVFFKCTNQAGLFFLTRCVDHRYWTHGEQWLIKLSVGDTIDEHGLPVTYEISSGSSVGKEAVIQAYSLIENMLHHLNHEGFLNEYYSDNKWYDELKYEDNEKGN